MIDLTEIICTRISHDLIGNIGAFANAVELMEDDDNEFLTEIKSTLKFSSTVLTSRLKFFRMVFGLTNSNLDSAETVNKTCVDYIKTLNPNYPIELHIKAQDNQHDLNRVLMLTVMTVADLIIKGGTIDIGLNQRQIIAKVTSQAPLAQGKIDAINGILQDKLPDNLSQYAPVFYLRNMGARISLNTDNGLVMSIS
jgi:hypothetical protein